MQTCATCVHWDDGRCLFITDAFNCDPGHPHSKKAVTQDSEEYAAWLITTPDFGCVEHVLGSQRTPLNEFMEE